MKNIIILLLVIPLSLSAQLPQSYALYIFNFEDTTHHNCLIIEDSNSVWQIGTPQKTIFNSAYSGNRVVCTDTLNSYGPSDTSSFIVKHVAQDGWFSFGIPGLYHARIFSGWYWVDSDSLRDYGTIEVSPNNGTSWYNLLEDSIFSTNLVIIDTPIFSGNSGGWKHFRFHIENELPGAFPTILIDDTILFRFSFISDSIDNQRDGLMFDDLRFLDQAEGINELSHYRGLQIWPNPTSDILHIKTPDELKGEKIILLVCNNKGQIIRNYSLLSRGNNDQLDVSELPEGMYYVVIYLGDRKYYARFMKVI